MMVAMLHQWKDSCSAWPRVCNEINSPTARRSAGVHPCSFGGRHGEKVLGCERAAGYEKGFKSLLPRL